MYPQTATASKIINFLITEPELGRMLVETDIQSETPTSFRVMPVGDGRRTRVIISTELKVRNVVEGFIAKSMLEKVYREELDLLASLAAGQILSTRSTLADKTRASFR